MWTSQGEKVVCSHPVSCNGSQEGERQHLQQSHHHFSVCFSGGAHLGRQSSCGPRAGGDETLRGYLPRAVCSVTLGSQRLHLLLHLFLLSMYQHRHMHWFPLRSSQWGWRVQWVLNPPESQLPKLEHPSVCTISDTVCCTAAAIGTPAVAVWMSLDKMWVCTNEDVICTPGIVDT